MKIYNTLSRQKEDFVPLQAGYIGMYVCGMTVYDYCHLGHARVLVAFDVITRYLRARGWKVNYVRNITDIDDKILNRAQQNNEPYQALTSRFIDAMHEDEDRLSIIRPDHEPRATAHIAAIIDLTTKLIDKGYAYQANNGDVYYSVSKFSHYGKLSGKKTDELLAGARIEIGESKHDPRDFALWKNAKPGEVSWPSPWGPGRPGWHIECSAMSTCCLGETFDIHGGGPDLPFPHHENEIAQSEAASGKQYARYWMHAGAVRVNNEKMSKSLGNFFTIREILDKYHPEVIRYLLIASHYRSAINYSEENLLTAKAALERFYTSLRGLVDIETKSLDEIPSDDADKIRFIAAMDDDFSTPEAISVLFDIARHLNASRQNNDTQAIGVAATKLKSMGHIFGLLQEDPDIFLQGGSTSTLDAETIEKLIAERQQAKQDRLFARADQIREELKNQGVILEDSRSGTTWRRE